MRNKHDALQPEPDLSSFAHESAGWREHVTKREVVETFTRTRFCIPHYGFLERIEVTPRAGLLPNMDASLLPYTIEITVRDPEGQEIECLVDAIFRNIKNPKEML